jgi:hypothetical protein
MLEVKGQRDEVRTEVAISPPTYTSYFCAGLWCNSSIFAREANGPGAKPGILTI